jgi:hypothetical protein
MITLPISRTLRSSPRSTARRTVAAEQSSNFAALAIDTAN